MRKIGLALTVVVALLLPGSVSAYPHTTPSVHDFGAQAVGMTSVPRQFTINARCTEQPTIPGTCIVPEDPFVPDVKVSGPFRVVDDLCTGVSMAQVTPIGTFCHFSVVFSPVAPGVATGIVNIGGLSSPVAVSGSGTATPVMIPPPDPAGLSPPKKKCKKKSGKRAAAAKKKRCKKKRR